ncbi:B12-binding domain-containing radical SAM protein [Trichlorobacter lovleyi]|uniref:B12-binding domain-containing radical SAM protein n=1 Tax=Trichlorobacter lovleyi TaxID=313985 RepID=UPI0023F0EB02|nr:cobalamin-dependent protein [Trichlorobacter lovleyi]
MKVLIVVYKFYSMPFMRYEIPLGLAYISAVLKRAGHLVDILNLNEYYADIRHNDFAPLKMLMERRFRQHDFDMVCTGGLSPFFDTLQQVVLAARQIKPGVITVMGGGIVTSEPELIMEHIPVDFGVIGEGEETIVELLSELGGAQRFKQVAGIIFRGPDGRLVKTASRPLIADLDNIPYPDYDGLNISRFLDMQMPVDMLGCFKRDTPRFLPILASRSCPFKCSFCFHPIGDKYRVRTLDSIFTELDYLVERYAINTLLIMDELFGFNRDYLIQFCERFKPYDMDLIVQLHVSQADETTIRLLKEAGCIFISYGIESASDTVLKSMRKNSTIAQIEHALALTRQAGIQIQGNFIFGDSAETDETASETLAWWLSHREYLINLGSVWAFPGSALWNDALLRGLIVNKVTYLKNESSALSKLNLTAMTDRNFEHLLRNIRHLDFHLRIPAKVISCKSQSFDYRKRRLYALTVECPHCASVMEYRNLHCPWTEDTQPAFINNRLGCRVCNQRFDILPYRVEEGLCEVLEKTRGLRLGVFSACSASINLLKFSQALRERVALLVDNSIQYGLTQVEGVPVLPLFNNLGQIEQQLDAILVPSEEINSEFFDDLLDMERHGMLVIRIGNLLAIPTIKAPEDALAYSRTMLDSAQAAISSGAPAFACTAALAVTDRFPVLADGHIVLAQAMEAAGDTTVALDAWHTAHLLSPGNVWVLEQLCRLSLQMGAYADALPAFERLQALAPESPTLGLLTSWCAASGAH